MSTLILDEELAESIQAQRAETGADRWDEVWDGVYMVMPLPNDEHQEIVTGFIVAFHAVVGPRGAKIRPGVNVSDRDGDWTQNYRGPDVVVFLEGTSAVNRGAYWLGGPDFAVEILSKGDRAREKLPFYSHVSVRELLLVDRNPWALELYRLREGESVLIGRSTSENQSHLLSEILPLSFRLVPGNERPTIEVHERGGERNWSV